MKPRIRLFEDRDAEAVVNLSLRTWAPVYASLEQAVGLRGFQATASGLARRSAAGGGGRLRLEEGAGVGDA
jgi:hypothetical protein